MVTSSLELFGNNHLLSNATVRSSTAYYRVQNYKTAWWKGGQGGWEVWKRGLTLIAITEFFHSQQLLHVGCLVASRSFCVAINTYCSSALIILPTYKHFLTSNGRCPGMYRFVKRKFVKRSYMHFNLGNSLPLCVWARITQNVTKVLFCGKLCISSSSLYVKVHKRIQI